jgi:hypothetical protein
MKAKKPSNLSYRQHKVWIYDKLTYHLTMLTLFAKIISQDEQLLNLESWILLSFCHV